MKEESFKEYMRNARNDFVKATLELYPHEANLPENLREKYLKGRVAAEDILICFDQMRDKLLNLEHNGK